ncbi:oxygen-independent coproporphyrinogen-3 oxidase [Actinoalloteichus hoggarensis]|uniref:Heme chaperone HemW n=1 Tax=Actinoalloteichus hoggarensis TaxID=1470176 RepID=A0A221W872_9PSEU|nr:radical SAM family heme chaperone HemW [Actinoalloteichus hoggarensis]ASO22118.1 Oxygen-independent coproporphyrinogen-III oxidase 1 [Actinoalloteichus hoggarensis]MBB5923801.1 oxygen-independent coproporphyrinogen-3 oxidase [Actinoalloteichus hoggarensis]
MPSSLPDGEPMPEDGALPASALDGLGRRPFGVYVHVPFCATRCGYCDFNTYTAGELGSGAGQDSWIEGVRREIALAAKALGAPPKVDTVFVGGGTPSLVGAEVLGGVLAEIDGVFGLADGAEITTEANPESTSPEFFAGLRAAGFTRVSLGMQSAARHVLAVLDRTHTPGRAVAAAREAADAGFEHVNLDLIYGTPGESDDDLRASLDAVSAAGVDHVSAYSLIVEDGTALARRVRAGELPAPDEDVLARRYELIDDALSAAGLGWYEVSNWASRAGGEAARCRHNIGYWSGGDWWGLGPGAHSHVGGVRWWNVKHPARYNAALAEGRSPGAGRELLDDDARRVERVLLELRLVEGLSADVLDESGRRAARLAVDDGLLTADALTDGRCVLTRRGRLLADGLVHRLLG